jgi:tetratricopeptide (TPR) repeat protein
MNTDRKYTEELLIDYVEGLLTTEQNRKVQAILEQDEYARSMVEGIGFWFEKNGYDREGLEAWLTEQESLATGVASQKSEPKVIPIRRYVVMGVAAVILLALIPLWFALQSPGYDEMLAEYSAEVYEYPHAVRNSDQAISEVLTSYDRGEYLHALDGFQQSLLEDPGDPLSEFMIGMCYFYEGMYDEAAAQLGPVARSNSRFSEQAHWYFALSFLQSGNYPKGKVILEEIVRRRTYRHEEAQLLLSKEVPDDHHTPK